jgi:hypothetical protein
MNTTKLSGIAIAAVAASLFVLAPVATAGNTAAAAAPTGKCMGGNSCKGTSSCKSFDHACKGQNSCKGKGFTVVTKADCDKAGGKFEANGGK